jgi:plastocyanin
MYTRAYRKPVVLLMLLAGIISPMMFTSGTRAQPPALEITLTLGDYRFTPDSIDVHAGQLVTLTLVNSDGLTPHNFTLQDAGAGLNIDRDVAAGATEIIEFTPAASGRYRFFCDKKLPFMKSHRARGMEGAFNVIEPSME